MDDNRLTPAEVRARFGELTAAIGQSRVHREFEDAKGLWRPVFDEDMALRHYQFYPGPKKATRKVVWRPRVRR